METGLQMEPVKYGILMPSPQFPQQATSTETSSMPFECVSIMRFFCKITY